MLNIVCHKTVRGNWLVTNVGFAFSKQKFY